MRDFIVFDGINSSAYALNVTAADTHATAERDTSMVSVPGRNGDLIIDNGRWKNVTRTYKVFGNQDFRQGFRDFADAISARVSYHRLEDSESPDVYRIARFSKSIDPDVGRGLHAGTFDVVFDCKPQNYLKSGEHVSTFTESGIMYNPVMFPATPKIRIYGTGKVYINDQLITVTENPTYIDLDCMRMDAVSGASNANPYVTLPKENIKLVAGENSIGLSGVTKVEIVPNWWTLSS